MKFPCRSSTPAVLRSTTLAFSMLAGLVLAPHSSIAASADPLDEPVTSLKFADQGLASCIASWAQEQHYATVRDVKEIPCFNRGITNIAGLEALTEATVIDLSRNHIQDFSPLFALSKHLGYVDIHENPIRCRHQLEVGRALRGAFRVGFDPASCLDDSLPTDSTPPPPVSAPTTPATSASAPSYAEIAPIVADRCGHCHQSGKHKGGVSLDDAAAIASFASDVAASIEAGRMPPHSRGWRDSTEGQRLLAYLATVGAAPGGSPGSTAGHRHGEGDDDDDDQDHEHGSRHHKDHEHHGHHKHDEHDD